MLNNPRFSITASDNLPEKLKILAVRLSSLGDIILTYPFVNEIKRLYPGSELVFLTKEQYAEAAEMHPGIDKILIYNAESRKAIAGYGFDVIFDLHRNQRTLKMLSSAGTRVIRVKKDSVKKIVLAAFKVNLLKDYAPVYRRYLNALKEFNSAASDEYTGTPGLLSGESRINGRYILVSPSSKHFTKRYPADRLLNLVRNVKTTIVLTGDSNETDVDVCSYLEKNLYNAVNLCGKTGLKELAGLIRNAELVICNDSGVLHLAETLGKKAFVFFGSTVKEFGFYPQLETTVVMENNNLECRPCTHIGRSDCPKKHFRCMLDIDTTPLEKELINY